MRETTLENYGLLRKLSATEQVDMLSIVKKAFPKYPVKNSCTYAIGDIQIAFPMTEIPSGLDDCDWGIVTDYRTGEVLALVPDISPNAMENLRGYMRIFGTYPIAFYHLNQRAIYYPEPNYSYHADCGWFPFEDYECINVNDMEVTHND